MSISQLINEEKKVTSKDPSDIIICPVTSAIEIIGGKWKVIILYHLNGQTLRFGQLKKLIPKITQKMLTQQLRELEMDNLITRKAYAEIPPRVEYTPSESANKLQPILNSLCVWASEHHMRRHK